MVIDIPDEACVAIYSQLCAKIFVKENPQFRIYDTKKTHRCEALRQKLCKYNFCFEKLLFFFFFF